MYKKVPIHTIPWKEIAYDKQAVGTPNPFWTKLPLGKVGGYQNSIERLARHICTRTAAQPNTIEEVFISVVTRNGPAIGQWTAGYELVTKRVWEILGYRDYVVKKLFDSRNK